MKVNDFLGLSPLNIDEEPNKYIHVQGRHIGIEKELESMRLHHTPNVKYWSIDDDGSLRNDGAELKFREPLKNNGIVQALKELDWLFKNYFQTPTHSIRTSEHFHVNIRDFTEENLNNLQTNILVLEQTLFNFGKIKFDRKHNTYCMPHWLYFNEYQVNLPKGIADYFTLPKYLSMGFNSQFGTIEFRMFESITQISEILRRVNVLLELVEYSKNIKYNGEDLVKFTKKLLPRSHKYLTQYLQESPKIEKIQKVPKLSYNPSCRLQKSLKKKQVITKVASDLDMNQIYNELLSPGFVFTTPE